MVDISQETLLNLYGSFLFLIVALLFLYQTRRKNRNTPTLTIGFFVAFAGQFLNSILEIMYLNGYFTDLQNFYLQVIFVTAINIVLVFFWIFFEQANDTKISTIFLVIIAVLGSLYLTAYILGPILGDILGGIIIGNLAFIILLNVVVLRSIQILIKIYKATDKERIALAQLIAFILIEVWALLGFIGSGSFFLNYYYGIASFPYNLQTLSDILYYTGLIIFIFTILLNPDYIYRLPLNIQDIVVLSKFGMALYGIGANAEEKSLDEQMLAGFLTAANAFISEMQPKHPNEVLRMLKSTGRILRMEFGDTLGVCLVSEKENYFLVRSIRNLVAFLEKQDAEDLIGQGMFFEDEDMRKWLKAYFPYLGIDKMQSY